MLFGEQLKNPSQQKKPVIDGEHFRMSRIDIANAFNEHFSTIAERYG